MKLWSRARTRNFKSALERLIAFPTTASRSGRIAAAASIADCPERAFLPSIVKFGLLRADPFFAAVDVNYSGGSDLVGGSAMRAGAMSDGDAVGADDAAACADVDSSGGSDRVGGAAMRARSMISAPATFRNGFQRVFRVSRLG